MMDMGVRTWGNSRNGSAVMLTGTYLMPGEISQRLLGALPALLVLPAKDLQSPLITYLADEIVKDEPGQQAVLDRLLIAVLRLGFPGRRQRHRGGTAPTATRWSDRPCGCCITNRHTRGRCKPWLWRPAPPGHRWLAASLSWLANHR